MPNPPLTPEDVLRKQVGDEVVRIFNISSYNSSEIKQKNTISIALVICFAYIHTQSDVTRYKSALGITHRSLKKKIYPADYLTMEALRVFEPKIYAYIKSEYPWKETIIRPMDDTHWMQEWHSFWLGLQAITFEVVSEENIDDVGHFILNFIFPPEITDVGKSILAKRIFVPMHFITYSRCLSALGIK